MGEYPITKEKFDFVNNLMAFTSIEDDETVGFFTMRRPSESFDELRFGFVVVDPSKRGKGYGKRDRAEYGKQLVTDLPKRLTKEYGKGFSRSNLQNMRNFYLSYPICQTLSGKLSWSHYCELLSISDEQKRSFYEKETINANWSVRELKRQIKTSLFERLLLSSGDENKEKVLELALKGNEINKASDVVKDPYVFEFLGIPEEKPIMASDLGNTDSLQVSYNL